MFTRITMKLKNIHKNSKIFLNKNSELNMKNEGVNPESVGAIVGGNKNTDISGSHQRGITGRLATFFYLKI